MYNTSQETIRKLPQFDRLIQPMTKSETDDLLLAIIDSDIPPTIHIWKGNHLFDQIIYNLCVENSIPYEIKKMSFDSINDAAIYICVNQLNNPKLSAEYRKYIIGQYMHHKLLLHENTGKYSTAHEIAASLSLAAGTILKYHTYSSAMNTVFEQNFEFAQMLLTNKIKISHENVIELSHLKNEEIKAVSNAAIKDQVDHITYSYIRNEVKWCHIQTGSSPSRRERAAKSKVKTPAIRQMPTYNPDAETTSLCMTIDSWISSIHRVKSSDNFAKISSQASLQLMKKLSLLEHAINEMQEKIVERTHE